MNQRKKLEQLCRYITRPAIANERLKFNSAGDVVLRLKSPYQDGTTHIVMSPLWSSCNGWSTYGSFSQQLKISKQTLAYVTLLTGFGRQGTLEKDGSSADAALLQGATFVQDYQYRSEPS